MTEAERERAAIVEWLRSAAKKPVPCNGDDALEIAANMIEAGWHIRRLRQAENDGSGGYALGGADRAEAE